MRKTNDEENFDFKPKSKTRLVTTLLIIVLITGFGCFAYARYFQYFATKTEPNSSKIINEPTNEKGTNVAPINGVRQPPLTSSNNTSVNTLPTPSGQIISPSSSNTSTVQGSPTNVVNNLQTRIDQCNTANTQRDAILNPIKQQISDLQTYYIGIPAMMAQRVKGTLTNQAQLDRMIQAEQTQTQTQINQLQSQLNQLSGQYPLCTY
jgi:hypothetical protein